ncbi:hypothetical protein ACFL6I_16240 [candidate division KSB1 bacterium]
MKSMQDKDSKSEGKPSFLNHVIRSVMWRIIIFVLIILLIGGIIFFAKLGRDKTTPTGKEVQVTACNDGMDNDNDTLIDYPADYGCHSPTDTDESFQQVDMIRTDLNSENDDANVFITSDGLEVYFISDRKTGYGWDFYHATRPDTSSSFSVPEELSSLSTTDPYENGIWVSDDGLRAYINRQPDVNRIYMASRPNLSGSFGAATELKELCEGSSCGTESLLPDELTVFFSNNKGRDNMGKTDIYMATRPSIDSAFDTIVNVASLNSAEGESGICLSRDGLSIFFSSARLPHLGGGDIWYSYRLDLSSDWSTPVKVVELSTARQEGVGRGCVNYNNEIWYNRDPTGANVDFEIYYAIR